MKLDFYSKFEITKKNNLNHAGILIARVEVKVKASKTIPDRKRKRG